MEITNYFVLIYMLWYRQKNRQNGCSRMRLHVLRQFGYLSGSHTRHSQNSLHSWQIIVSLLAMVAPTVPYGRVGRTHQAWRSNIRLQTNKDSVVLPTGTRQEGTPCLPPVSTRRVLGYRSLPLMSAQKRFFVTALFLEGLGRRRDSFRSKSFTIFHGHQSIVPPTVVKPKASRL